MDFLTNTTLESEKIPEEWYQFSRRRIMCSNHRGIKLISHLMKPWEKAVEAIKKRDVDQQAEVWLHAKKERYSVDV